MTGLQVAAAAAAAWLAFSLAAGVLYAFIVGDRHRG